MAKRRSKQHAGAKQDAPYFDYSPAEWSEIEAAARAVLPDGKALPNEVRVWLVDLARIYRFELRLQHFGRAKDRGDWQRIVHLSERLHQAVLAKIQEDRKIVRGYSIEASYLGLEEPLKGVLQIKKYAKKLLLSLSKITDFTPSRVNYQHWVLGLWVDLGGKLRFSRSKRGPQGPCIRFFRAVTTPVMGASAPSLESIPDIIRRVAALQKANGDSQ